MDAALPQGRAEASPARRVLETPRLRLWATTLDDLRVELERPQDLGAHLGARVQPSWPPGEYDHDALEFFRTCLEAGGPASVGWYGWYAIHRATEDLVAGGGYLGPPAEGAVEIGYSVVLEARGQGYATEIVEALLAHAFASGAVDRVIAHTQEGNEASAGVLLKSGFRRVGEGAEAGTVLYEVVRSR